MWAAGVVAWEIFAGRQLFRAADFEEADRRASHAATLFNAALAWRAATEAARSADDHAAALARGQLTSLQARRSREALDVRRPTVAVVRVAGSRDVVVSVDHVEHRSLPAVIHLMPGRRTLSFQHPDVSHTTETRDLLAGGISDITARAAPGAPQRKLPTPDMSGPRHRPPDSPERRTYPPLRGFGVAACGAVVLATVAAVYLGARTFSAKREFDESQQHSQAAHDRAVALRSLDQHELGGRRIAGVDGRGPPVAFLI